MVVIYVMNIPADEQSVKYFFNSKYYFTVKNTILFFRLNKIFKFKVYIFLKIF